MEYLNFDLLVDKWGEQYKARVLDSPVGQASCIFDPPFTSKEVNPFLVDRRVQKMGFKAAKQLGRHLFRALLADDVGTCWHSSYQLASEKGVGLRLRLRLADVPELAALPWEYLYMPSQDRFLSLSIETPVVRYLELSQKVSPLSTQAPLRILVMMATPLNAAPLNSDQEWKRLRQALLPLEQKGFVTLSRLPQGTLAGLRQQLRKQTYHIFHFIGHGAFDTLTEEGGVLLEDNKKRARFVSGQQLGIVLRDHRSLRLAVLNACEGARTSHRDPFGGTAQRLVQQGIPAVIAMQFQIKDKGAIAFASEFYAALADGYSVDAALSEGRKSLAEKDHLAWGIPVLYMRSSDGHLFEIAEQKEVADQARPPAAKKNEVNVAQITKPSRSASSSQPHQNVSSGHLRSEFDYDLFISYSQADKAWVRGELLPRLEANGLRVCIDFRDFEMGAPVITEIERAVLSSRKMLLVLTPHYLAKEWSEFGNLMLQTLDPAARRRRLLPLMKESCQMPLRISYLIYLDFTRPEEEPFAWRQLLNTLGVVRE